MDTTLQPKDPPKSSGRTKEYVSLAAGGSNGGVGLDTAFYDHSPLFFRGTINDPVQKEFLRNIRQQAMVLRRTLPRGSSENIPVLAKGHSELSYAPLPGLGTYLKKRKTFGL